MKISCMFTSKIPSKKCCCLSLCSPLTCNSLPSLPLQPECDINARTNNRLTALHIAVHEGHVKLVERLVGFGADLNITTSDGNTALHLALGRNTMAMPTEESPKIKAVRCAE